MVIHTSEQAFETVIEAALLDQGYLKRSAKDYDPAHALIPQDLFDFIQASQPKMWDKFLKIHGGKVAEAKAQFCQRLSRDLNRRGTLALLRDRKGFRLEGCAFRLIYFKPVSGLNPETQKLYQANRFAVLRQLYYKPHNPDKPQSGPSLDLGLFINGLPIFTAELKNQITGQTIENAKRQYQERDSLDGYFFYSGEELDRFARIYLTAGEQTAALPQLHAILDGVIERYHAAPDSAQVEFRKALNDYIRLYAFLAQTARFEDDNLEKLYLFGKFLSRKLHPHFTPILPLEIREQVELESLRVRQTGSGKIDLARGEGKLEPLKIKEESASPLDEEQESLSAIIKALNHIYGFEASEEEVITVQRVEAKLDESAALKVSAEVNSKENFKLSFENAVKEKFDELLEDNFKLYKKIMDDPDFAKNLLDVLFERYLKRLGSNGEALNGL